MPGSSGPSQNGMTSAVDIDSSCWRIDWVATDSGWWSQHLKVEKLCVTECDTGLQEEHAVFWAG